MRTHSKTPLFLMELIIMLLVFSASAAVCLRAFAGAKRISEESSRLDTAVLEAQAAAEYWKASHGDIEETAERMGALPDEDSFKIYYEEEWMQLEFISDGLSADISVYHGEKEIFSLECEAVMMDD